MLVRWLNSFRNTCPNIRCGEFCVYNFMVWTSLSMNIYQDRLKIWAVINIYTLYRVFSLLYDSRLFTPFETTINTVNLWHGWTICRMCLFLMRTYKRPAEVFHEVSAAKANSLITLNRGIYNILNIYIVIIFLCKYWSKLPFHSSKISKLKGKP